MKKLISILVVLVLLFNTIGHIIVFKSMRYSIRKEVKTIIKQNIPNHKLVAITIDGFSENDIRFVEKDEFIYKGKMYDIVKKETKGNTVTYYCFNDTKEEELFASLNTEVQKNMDSNPVKQKAQQILKKISISLFFNVDKIYYQNTSQTIIFPDNSELLSDLSADVLTPPPKQV